MKKWPHYSTVHKPLFGSLEREGISKPLCAKRWKGLTNNCKRGLRYEIHPKIFDAKYLFSWLINGLLKIPCIVHSCKKDRVTLGAPFFYSGIATLYIQGGKLHLYVCPLKCNQPFKKLLWQHRYSSDAFCFILV